MLTAEELEAGRDFGRYLDVDGDGIPYRTYPGTHPTTRRLLHPRHLARPLRPLHRGGRRPTSTTCSACCASSRPRRRSCRRRSAQDADAPDALRRDLFRLDRAADARGARGARGARASTSTRCACAPSPSPTRWSTSSSRTTRCSSSSRTATRSCARCSSTRARIDPARLISVLHYDGTPITARFIVDDDRRRWRALDRRAAQGGGRMTYLAKAQAPPPDAADERARLHPPRLRGRGLDAVRRLRPRFDLGARSSRPASSSSLPPHRVAKLSGIGCSSKTPTYFLGASHGFNSVHGRMPSVLTGANLANRDLIYLGVSGDGDSASIGLGQFAHCLRRGVNMVYIVENNGVYGLTKGQFSATADKGSKSKKGVGNQDSPIDLVSHGAPARRDLRRAQLLRRQGAARAADQGGDRAPRRRLHRRASARASPSTTTRARPRATTTSARTTRR